MNNILEIATTTLANTTSTEVIIAVRVLNNLAFGLLLGIPISVIVYVMKGRKIHQFYRKD